MIFAVKLTLAIGILINLKFVGSFDYSNFDFEFDFTANETYENKARKELNETDKVLQNGLLDLRKLLASIKFLNFKI